MKITQAEIYSLLNKKRGKEFTFNEIKESLDISKGSCYQNLKRLVRRAEVKTKLKTKKDHYRSVYWIDAD